MTFLFATLTADRLSAYEIANDLALNRDAEALFIEPRADGSVWIGQSASSKAQPARLMGDILALFIATAGFSQNNGLRIKLLFSGVETRLADLQAIVDRWVETGEPPVMSIIGFRIGENDSEHITVGLEPFVGGEIAVFYRNRVFERDALRDLARLVRHKLMGEKAEVGMRFDGVTSDVSFVEDNAGPPEANYWFSSAKLISALN